MARRMVTTLVICATTAAACLFAGNPAASSATDKRTDESLSPVQNLRSPNEPDRKNAEKAIREWYNQTVDELIEMAGQQLGPMPSKTIGDYAQQYGKHSAMMLLGDLHATKAVPTLLANLEYRNLDITIVGSFVGEGQWYVAAGALSKIGMPAVGPVVQKLGTVGPKSRSGELCCWILREILGEKLGRARVRIAIEETQDKATKDNLTVALPYFRTPEEKAAEERAKQKEPAN